MMTQDELSAAVQRSMNEKMFRKPGAVLFSGISAMKPSRFYVMGLNPGGCSKTVTRSIIDTLAPADGTSPYTHQCWNKACGAKCEHLTGETLAETNLVRHQKNMIALTRVLGYETPTEMPVVNAIFARSCRLATLASESEFGAWDWWKVCWPVHKRLLELVRPKIIITLGYGMNTSPLGFLACQVGVKNPTKIGDSNRRGGRQIDCSLPLLSSTLDVRVIGIPHPSFYGPGPELLAILRGHAA